MKARHTTALNILLGFLIPVSLFVIGHTAYANDPLKFVPLVGIPNVSMNLETSLPDYLNELYILTIGVGSLIAVVQLMIAGVAWSMSEIVTEKSEAKKKIFGTLFGLALLLIPFITLKTINPDLVNLDILGNLQPLGNIQGPAAPPSSDPLVAQEQLQNQVINCQSQQNSQWDSLCNKCILGTEKMGSACNWVPPPTVAKCSDFTLDPSMTCSSFCSKINGTYSSDQDTCTYKGG